MEGSDLVRREQYLERALPSSEDAERVILGAILVDNALAVQVIGRLRPDDFYSPLNRRIFTAMAELFRQDKPVDPVLILEEMKKVGPVDAIGGVATIAALSYGLPNFSSLKEYVKAVFERSEQRQLIRACNAIVSQALQEDTDHAELMAMAEQKIFELTAKPTDHEPELIDVLAAESVMRHAQQQREGIVVTGFRTGLEELDDKTGGFKPGNLIILGGRPSMGKTALMTQTVFDGLEPEAVALMFSLEMTKDEVTSRHVCQNAKVNLWSYEHNCLRKAGWDDIAGAQHRFDSKLLYIDDSPALSPIQMLSRARRIKTKHKRLDMVCIDHIGLMSSSKPQRSRYDEMTNISKDLKSLARTLGCPVLALSQLSRAVETRKDPRPLMSDLRETGAIEQDADLVIFVYREEYYPSLRSPANIGLGELIIAKQRNGPTDTVKVLWAKEFAKFENMKLED
jgi:replicative DNA helicase